MGRCGCALPRTIFSSWIGGSGCEDGGGGGGRRQTQNEKRGQALMSERTSV